jgi:mono/diheme cytochrome c family protein
MERLIAGGARILIAVLPLLALPLPAEAQGRGPVRSSRDGVYTAVQAARGSDTFATICTGCHTPESHTGPVFMGSWGGSSLWDLFIYLSEQMPKTDPGTLSAREYLQVVAYILELNGMPAGSAELPADSAGLSRIRLDTAKAADAAIPINTRRRGES